MVAATCEGTRAAGLPADSRPPQLNKKVKKADGEVLEGYRKSFNLQLQLVFGESVRAWAHVNNWFYLHAGARRAPASRLPPLARLWVGTDAPAHAQCCCAWRRTAR